MFTATGCFIGNVSVAPGTFGSALGIPLCFLISKIELTVALVFTIILIFFAIVIAHEAEKILGEKDPGCIVIDEIAGLMVALIGLPFNIISVLTGFLVFRVFDILKPYPIRHLEVKLSGGVAIVMDDVVAGIYSNIILRMGMLLLN
jgi:phosphatidylglycerophosphatase A